MSEANSHQPPRVLASLVVGANGASSLAGASAGLATPEDRGRFLALRKSQEISAILVGARTATIEPYQKTPHPLYIYRRESGLTPRQYLESINRKHTGAILCEGGITLIHQLLHDGCIDIFHLTRVAIEGDGHFLDENLLNRTMALISREVVNQTTFEKYERASR